MHGVDTHVRGSAAYTRTSGANERFSPPGHTGFPPRATLREDARMQVIGDVPVFGDPVDPGALGQIQRCRSTADGAALMADHHLGYAVPIGGVVVYKDAISPSGVGYDIGCGNKAVLTDMPGAEARARIKPLMDDIWKRLSFGMGLKNQQRVDSPVFERDEWELPVAAKLKKVAQDVVVPEWVKRSGGANAVKAFNETVAPIVGFQAKA